MKEKTLLKISLTISLLGLVVIFIFYQKAEMDTKDIGKISISDINKNVKIKGQVQNVGDKNGIIIMEISQPERITAILFKKKNESINIKKGDIVEIFGSVEQYKGKFEIVANRIRIESVP